MIINEENLECDTYEGVANIYTINPDDPVLELPDEYQGLKINSIDFGAIIEGDIIEKFVGSKYLKSIAPTNFQNCMNLKEIDISNTEIESFEEETFSECANLQNILLPSNLKSLYRAFNNCDELDVVVIPDKCESVKDEFKNCHINTLKIGKNVKELSFGKNFECDNIEIDSENKNFCVIDGVLYSADKKTLLYVPSSIKNFKAIDEAKVLGDNVLAGQTFETLDLNNIEILGKSSLFETKAKTILANNVIKCQSMAFNKIEVENIELKKLTFYDPYLFKSSKIKNIIPSDNLTTICEGAFSECDIMYFKCPKLLSVIDDYAFADSMLEKIDFNEALREIGQCVFQNCLQSAIITLPTDFKVLRKSAFTYSENAQYNLNKDLEYCDGIYFANNYVECKNIFAPIQEDEISAYFAGTNLEKVSISTARSMTKMLEEGTLSLRAMNKMSLANKGVIANDTRNF